MKSQTIYFATLITISTFASAQDAIDYSKPVTVTVSAKCPGEKGTKLQWFSLLSKLSMEPSATVAVFANPDMSVNSTELTYSGSKSGITSSNVVESTRMKVELLATETLCNASLHIDQVADGG